MEFFPFLLDIPLKLLNSPGPLLSFLHFIIHHIFNGSQAWTAGRSVPFSIYGAFTDVQVNHAMGTKTPPYHHRGWLLNFALITIWMFLFLFGPEDTTSMISQHNLKCGLVRPRHTFPLCVRLSQMSSGQEKLATFLDVVDIGHLFCIVEF